MALSAARNTPQMNGGAMPPRIYVPLATATTVYQGGVVAVDSAATGYGVAGKTATTLTVMGVAEDTVTNSGANGATGVNVRPGVFKFANSSSGDAIDQACVGAPCYLVDDQTVAKTDGSSTRSQAGEVIQVDADGVWVVMGPYPIPGATTVTTTAAQTLTNKRYVHRVGTDITGNGTVQVADGEVFEVIPGSGTTITLGTTNVAEGDRFLFMKPGTEAYSVAVGSLITMPASTTGFVECVYMHGAWKLGVYAIRSGGRPIPVQAAAISFVANDVTVAVADGEEFDIPTTSNASTVTLATTNAVAGSKMRFRADGTKNGHTVTYRVGATAITAAATASKRHLCDCSFDGTTWVASLSVGP